MSMIRYKKQDLVQMKDSKNKNLKEDQVLKLKKSQIETELQCYKELFINQKSKSNHSRDLWKL